MVCAARCSRAEQGLRRCSAALAESLAESLLRCSRAEHVRQADAQILSNGSCSGLNICIRTPKKQVRQRFG
jgi:hypothetical protein